MCWCLVFLGLGGIVIIGFRFLVVIYWRGWDRFRLIVWILRFKYYEV